MNLFMRFGQRVLIAAAVAGMLLATGAARGGVVQAAGGDVTEDIIDGGVLYRVHYFTETGLQELEVTVGGTVQVFMVGGGGGGAGHINAGTWARGSGGGAGGLVFRHDYDIQPGPVGIFVGAGGQGGRGNVSNTDSSNRGSSGEDSVFDDNLTAIGGGGGGSRSSGDDGSNPGKDGGSGGGKEGAALQPGSGTGGYGNAGAGPVTSDARGGGGAGADGDVNNGGDGLYEVEIGEVTYNFRSMFGDIVGEDIEGESWFAGGGAGAGTTTEGGKGGGGDGGANQPRGDRELDGLSNTGGGGGGVTAVEGGGGDGGSGIVIVRYVISADSPVVQNLPVTNVTTTGADLTGYLVSAGATPTTVSVYWGEDPDGWANWHTWDAGEWGEGDEPVHTVSDLDENKTCYYTFGAENDAGGMLASPPIAFITGEVSVVATDDQAQWPDSQGVLTISRPSGTANEALTVYFTMSGTAAEDEHYTLSHSGSITIPAGETDATVTLFPKLAGSGTAILELSGQHSYPVSDENGSATVTIFPAPAAILLWTGAEGADWDNPENWETSGESRYPQTNTDIAFVETAPGPASIPAGITLGAMTLHEDFAGTLDMLGTLTICSAAGASGDLTVNAGTLRTHTSTAAADAYSGNITVSNTFTIGSGGTVVVRRSSTAGDGAGQTLAVGNLIVEGILHADGQGFTAGQGPGGSGSGSRGGSHGGRGAMNSGPTYGSVTNPVALGSGGSGASGGGAIVIQADDDVSVRNGGLISARGADGHAGSGGTISVTANTLSGNNGIIQARGGNETSWTLGRGGGGGGRIAVVLRNDTSFGDEPFTIDARGGTRPNVSGGRGAAGTVYLQNAVNNVLIIDNGDLTSIHQTELSPDGDNLNAFDSVLVRNRGNLSVRSNDTLDFGSANTVGDGTGSITVSATDGIAFPANFLLSTKYTLCLDVPVSAEGDWTIPDNVVLTHNPNNDHGLNINLNFLPTRKLDLTLTGTGNLTVQTLGKIDADGRGHGSMRGTGAPSPVTGGGSHGGRGGDTTSGPTYGFVQNPTALGSGGGSGGSGGGTVILDIAGVLTLEGAIGASGHHAASSGGSGGSINITATHLTGDNGIIRARGGNETTWSGGRYGGGGGRIAVVLREGTVFGGDNFHMDVYGGYRINVSTSTERGAAGTLYLETADSGPGSGKLIINNPHTTALKAVTELPASHATLSCPDELQRVTLVIKGKGKVGLTADITVGDLVFED